jgi:hypothetical protein
MTAMYLYGAGNPRRSFKTLNKDYFEKLEIIHCGWLFSNIGIVMQMRATLKMH